MRFKVFGIAVGAGGMSCLNVILTNFLNAAVSFRTKRSKVWLHFTWLDEDSRCHEGNKIFASKGDNNSNLTKHFSTRHGITVLLVTPC